MTSLNPAQLGQFVHPDKISQELFVETGAQRGTRTLHPDMANYVLPVPSFVPDQSRSSLTQATRGSESHLKPRRIRKPARIVDAWGLAMQMIGDLGTSPYSVLVVADLSQYGPLKPEISSTSDFPNKNLTIMLSPWIKGMLTNFPVVRSTVTSFVSSPDHEKNSLKRKRYQDNYGAIEGMVRYNQLPKLIVFLTPEKHIRGINEASKLSIPMIGVANTDCTCSKLFTRTVPGNTASLPSQRLYRNRIRNSCHSSVAKVKYHADHKYGVRR